ncbi:hypothetical protein F5Y01DRAFT_270561 [Xylaria sp. FL0043]|nr:hypothetical protein F5Y01DRAFT_270561 [Xylaria sp. FL0043]
MSYSTGGDTSELKPPSRIVNKKLGKMDIQESTGLSMLPPEILADILGELPNKRDWLALAKTCRCVSGVIAQRTISSGS